MSTETSVPSTDEIRMSVQGMTCGHCVATVRKSLEAVEGVPGLGGDSGAAG